MTAEMKACPFCRRHRGIALDELKTDEGVVRVYFVACRNCMAGGPMRTNSKKAIAAWNAAKR